MVPYFYNPISRNEGIPIVGKDMIDFQYILILVMKKNCIAITKNAMASKTYCQ